MAARKKTGPALKSDDRPTDPRRDATPIGDATMVRGTAAKPDYHVMVSMVHEFRLSDMFLRAVLSRWKGEIMATVLELIEQARTALDTKFDTALASNKSAIEQMRTQIADLTQKVNSGEASDEEKAALAAFQEDMEQKMDVLNPEQPTTVSQVRSRSASRAKK